MKILMTLLCLALFPAQLLADDLRYLQSLNDASYHHVDSAVIGRGFHVYVIAPAGRDNDADKKYPTIYLLDGGSKFPLLAPYYRSLNAGEGIPDAIVVGISYGNNNFNGGNYRGTDYTAPSSERDSWGGAEKYQKFLADELFPLIEKSYESDAQRRIVFGQSLGGQFVLYTALTRPNLFWGHIANNPALHRNLPYFLAPAAEADPLRDRSYLFVGSATGDQTRFRRPAEMWMNYWSSVEETPWELKAVDLEGHTHLSSAPAAFRQGLHWIFSTK